MSKKTVFLTSILFCAAFAFSPPASFSEEDTAAIGQLDSANSLFQRGMYKMAINEYAKFIESFPESVYLHEAYFGIAESWYFLKDYNAAIAGYKRYTAEFPMRDKTAVSELRIGQALFFSNYRSVSIDVTLGICSERKCTICFGYYFFQ